MTGTEIVLIRHGEAHCNVEQVHESHTCRGLTTLGRTQAAHLAQHLTMPLPGTKSLPGLRPYFSAIYTSPIERAHQTAQLIGTALKMPVSVDKRLTCLGCGALEGRPWQEAVDAVGAMRQLLPDAVAATGAETWRAYLNRTAVALRVLAARHRAGRVLIVAHAETFEAAMVTFSRLPSDSGRWRYLIVDNTAITIWRHYPPLPHGHPDGSWALVTHNDTRHLAGSLAPRFMAPLLRPSGDTPTGPIKATPARRRKTSSAPPPTPPGEARNPAT